MKQNDQEAIIFDLGGVIINLDYSLTQKAFENLGLENFGTLYSQLVQAQLFDQLETGKISAQHFINELLRVFPKSISPNKIVAAWNAMILDVPKEKIQLLERLRNSKKIYLLSNTNEIHIEKVRRVWAKVSAAPLETYFDKIFLSHEIKMRKPNKDIFEFVCKDQNLDPSKTLFIDDSPQHIEGAKSIGLQVYHLQNAEDLYRLFD